MSHLWVEDPENRWAVMPLGGEAYRLDVRPPEAFDPDSHRGGSVTLLRTGGPARMSWVLLAAGGSAVWVNGLPLTTGVRVVRDKDEIRVPSTGPVYFSNEQLPVIEDFPGGDRAVDCPRCKQEIRTGDASVRCTNPQCAVWYHQTKDLPCFDHADQCAMCGEETNLEAGFRWTPGEL